MDFNTRELRKNRPFYIIILKLKLVFVLFNTQLLNQQNYIFLKSEYVLHEK